MVYCVGPETNITTSFHIYAISFRGIHKRCICICVTYIRSLASIMWPGWLYTCLCNYISSYWHISLNKYDYHIANASHSAHILYKQINTTLVHICAKTQPNATSNSHVTAIYVPETNMPAKFHIYAIYLKGIYREYVYVCARHEVSGVNNFIRNAVHMRQWRWQLTIAMAALAYWQHQPKNTQ